MILALLLTSATPQAVPHLLTEAFGVELGNVATDLKSKGWEQNGKVPTIWTKKGDGSFFSGFVVTTAPDLGEVVSIYGEKRYTVGTGDERNKQCKADFEAVLQVLRDKYPKLTRGETFEEGLARLSNNAHREIEQSAVRFIEPYSYVGGSVDLRSVEVRCQVENYIFQSSVPNPKIPSEILTISYRISEVEAAAINNRQDANRQRFNKERAISDGLDPSQF